MKKCIAFCLTLGVLIGICGSLRADVFVQSESSRVYMDNERKQATELWLAEGKSCQKSGTRVTIMRQDLNKWWSIDLGQKTYSEFSLQEAQSPSAKKDDVHTLWLNYSPEYEWKVTEKGDIKNINGLACRLFQAKGVADFAEVDGEYWLADSAATPAGKVYHDFLVKQLGGDADRVGLLKLLAEHPNGVPVLRLETIEHSIAPTIRQTSRIAKIEEAAAPAGIYDLPAGLKKLEDKDS